MNNYKKSGLERIIASFSTQEAAKKALKLLQKHKLILEEVSLEVQESNLDSSVVRTLLAQGFKGAIVGGFLFGALGLTVSLLFLSVNQGQTLIFHYPSVFVSVLTLCSCAVGCLVFGSICGFYDVFLLKARIFTQKAALSNKYLLVIKGSETEVDFATNLLRLYI